jgi:hypothetical protein
MSIIKNVDIVTFSHKLRDRPITTVQIVGTMLVVPLIMPQFERLNSE